MVCVEDLCIIESEVDSDAVGEDSESDVDMVKDSDTVITEDSDPIEDSEVDSDAVEDSDSIVDVDSDVVEDSDIEIPDWDTVGWVKYDDLYWSEASSETMTFENANIYCKNMGARVPTINELRGVSTCAISMIGGLCGFTDVCTVIPDCWSSCDVMCEIIEGKLYNIFNDDIIKLGSSTIGEENINGNMIKYNVYINFIGGQIAKTDDYNKLINFRCVK